MNIEEQRHEFKKFSLKDEGLPVVPQELFEKWFNAVKNKGLKDFNAMFLSTVDDNHKPHSRTVLLKEFYDGHFVFFSSYISNKGRDLLTNTHASLLFFWPEFERQIRIEGEISKTEREKSEEYFFSRPRGSQIAAMCFIQSEVVESRKALDERFAALENKYKNKEIPYPDFWGGYKMKANYYEFWQGRENRLHDRIAYEATPSGWDMKRLAP